MKRIFALLSIASLGLASLSAQQINQTSQNGPVFHADKMEVDFGDVPYKGDGVREFRFRNSGSTALTITNAKGSCGCTVPEWPKEPIRPGETGIIRIKYDTSRSGPIMKTVTITTNEVQSVDAAGNPVYKQHTISVKGNVRPAPQNDALPIRNNSLVPQD